MLQNGVSQFCATLIRWQTKNCYLLQFSSCTIAITDRNASSCNTAGEQPSGCVKNLGGLAPSGRLLRHDIDPKASQPAYDSLNGSVSPDAQKEQQKPFVAHFSNVTLFGLSAGTSSEEWLMSKSLIAGA